MSATCHANLILFCDEAINISWKIQIMDVFIMQFHQYSCYFLPLVSDYSLSHSFLKHSQFIFFP